MSGIFQKELSHYFKTPIGYIFIAVFLVITGAYFFMVNLVSQNGDIKAFFSSIFTLLMFLIPILTMGLFSEEKKQNTDQLLLTAPVSITAVIVGKFLSTMVVFALPLGVTLAYPAVLAAFGAFEPMVTVGNYLGILLLGSAFVALGLFISVLTENQLVAAVVTYAALLILFLSDSAKAVAPPPLQSLLGFISLTGHYQAFTYGVLNPADIIFYLSTTSLFLFLSVYMLESKRIA